MVNAGHDQNGVPTLTAALNTTGATIVQVVADPTSHALSTSEGTTGTDFGPSSALHDSNHIPTMMAVSSSDGTTPIVLYATSGGALLIDSI